VCRSPVLRHLFVLAGVLCLRSGSPWLVAPQVACEMRVMIGDARIAICEAAEEAKADALVVGSRGHGALKR